MDSDHVMDNDDGDGDDVSLSISDTADFHRHTKQFPQRIVQKTNKQNKQNKQSSSSVSSTALSMRDDQHQHQVVFLSNNNRDLMLQRAMCLTKPEDKD